MNLTPPHVEKAKKLIQGIRLKGITDDRILNALQHIPRHYFVEDRYKEAAYEDKPLPIGKEQTISQPFTVAYQTMLLDVQEGDKILEIGTGSGYQAAVLCELGAKVFSIERYEHLHSRAKCVLQELNYTPQLFFGDGYLGLPQYAPFDKILITAATDTIPEVLKKQLAMGGKMVLPLGSVYGQVMTVLRKVSKEEFQCTDHGGFVFVPMLKGVEKEAN